MMQLSGRSTYNHKCMAYQSMVQERLIRLLLTSMC